METFFGIPLVHANHFLHLLIRFAIDMAAVLTLIGVLYYRRGGRKDYFFTDVIISVTVFLLCILLDNVKLDMGFALGLFAVFGIIRYRTESIPIKEMTYLFAAIGLSIVNALANKKVSYAELVFTNVALLGTAAVLEYCFLGRAERSEKVRYDRMDLIVPEKRAEMLADLRARLGFDVVRVEVGEIDFLHDIAFVTVFYRPRKERKGGGA